MIVSLQKEGLNDDFSGQRSESDGTIYSGFTASDEVSLLRLQGNGYVEEIYLENPHNRIPITPHNIFSRNYAGNHIPWNRQSRNTLLVIPSLNQQTSERNPSNSNNDDILTFTFSHAGLNNLNTIGCENKNALHFLRHDDQLTLFIELHLLTGQCLLELPENTPVSLISAELTRHSKAITLPLEATLPNTTDQAAEKPEEHLSAAALAEVTAQDSALVVYFSPATTGKHLHDQHYETLYTTRVWLIARNQADNTIEADNAPELDNHQVVLSDNFKFKTPPDRGHLKSSHKASKKITPEEIRNLKNRLSKKYKQLIRQNDTDIKKLHLALPAIDITIKLIRHKDQIKKVIMFPGKKTIKDKSALTAFLDDTYGTTAAAITFLSTLISANTYEDISSEATVNGEKTTYIDVMAECYSALPSLLTRSEKSLSYLTLINQNINEILVYTISASEATPDDDKLKKRLYSALAKIFKTIISNGYHFKNDKYTYNMFSIAGQFFINESNLDIMFLLAQHLSQHYKKNTYSNVNEDDKEYFTDDLFDLIWQRLKVLMPDVDIPAKQLYDFEQQARDTGIDTNGWIDHINSYEQAKQNLRSHNEAILDQQARKNADQLIKEMEEIHQKNQEKLSKARQTRSQRAVKPTIKTDLTEPTEALSDTATTEASPDAEPLSDKTEAAPWKQLYNKGIHELTSQHFDAARSFFLDALNAQPGLLDEATIYSAIADTYFVPGETQQKAIRRAFAQTQLLLNEMRHATHLPVNRDDLNSLTEQFLSFAEKLDNPIKHSAENHLKSIQCLEAVTAQQLEDISAKNHANELLAILKQEGEQLEQIQELISKGVNTLLITYDLRKDFIVNMSVSKPTNELPSKESKYKQSLLSLKNQLSPGLTEKNQVPAKTKRPQNRQIGLEPDTLFSSFFQALKQADELSSKLTNHSEEAKVDSHTQKINRELISKYCKANPDLNFKKLKKALKTRIIKPSNIQSLINQLNNNASFSYNAQPQPDDFLNQFLTSHNRMIVDVDANHFCMFNAITLWLNHNREATSAFPNIKSGQDLFLALAPYAIQLAVQHPENSELNAIAAAFYVNNPNIQLWGTTDMLHTLISPILGIPIMVFDSRQIEASQVINATLYDSSGSVLVIEQDQIFNVVTRNTLVLVHNSNHWMAVLPAPERYDPAETLPDPAEHQLNTPLLYHLQK